MSEEEGQGSGGSMMKMVLFIAVLIGVFIALKFIMGFVWTIVKWMALGTLALAITYFVIFRKKKGSTSNS